MNQYFSPEEAANHLLRVLKRDFPDGKGGIDIKAATEKILGDYKFHLKDMKFAIAHPTYAKHSYLIWDYVGLRLTSVFEKNVRFDNRSSS